MEDDVKTSNEQIEDENESSEEESMDQDDESGPEEVTEKVVDPEVHKLELEVEANPYKYDSHLRLIQLIRGSGDLDKLREARHDMSKIFPLTEELWLEWIKDELPLACLPENRKAIISLFEQGVKDYQSVKLWIEYCQFIMDNMEGDNGLASVRDVFEKAIVAAGLHVTEGSSIWDGYRDFELAILDSFEQMLKDENKDTMEEKIQSQKERVKSLFRRQVSIPLLGMQGTMQDFEDWLDEEEDVPVEILQTHAKALAKLEEIIPYEDTIASADSPKLGEYRSYLEYEVKKGDPARIQCLYERALKENCLVGDLWIEYTGYVDTKLRMSSVILPVYERALRNCPWVSILWQNYMKALERSKAEETTIKETLDKALTCGFANAQDYLQLWHCYCSFLRRQVQDWKPDSEKVKALREGFQNAIDYLEHYFGKDGDSTNLLHRYWARVEAFKMNDIEEAQKIWEKVMTGHARELDYWLEYANLARSCRSLPLCRKILQRAVQSASDNPEGATQALLSLEDEEGTLDEWDASYSRCHTRLIITNERRAKAAEKEAAREAEKAALDKAAMEKRKNAKASKRQEKKQGQPNKQNLKRKAKDPNNEKPGFAPRDFSEAAEPVAKKPHVEISNNLNEQEEKVEEVEKPKYDRSTDSRKIFVSNLLFKVTEEQLKEKFSTLGEVADVRIVKNLAGRSKGYAYIEFKDESPVPVALELDRSNMEGRPMFISPCIDKAKNPTTFKFPTSLDKKTLFVSNLPFAIKESEVEEIFKKFGDVKQVRLVSNKAGKPKGFGYVEFADEQSASKAVVATDGSVVSERTISVALSNPPTRKPTRPEQPLPPPPPPGSRGRSKTQLALVPRALQKKTTTSSAQETLQEKKETKLDDNEGEEKKGFSNDYFSKLMQK